MAKREGRWVFMPLPKWESLPASFYNLRKAQIFLTCFQRNIRRDLLDWCMENDVCPPSRWRRARTELWIEQMKTSARALVNFPSSNAARGVAGSSKGQGRRFSQVKQKTDALGFD